MRTFIGLAAAAMAAASLAAAVPEFEPNAGQADSRYSFLARASGTRVYIADSALEFEPAVRLKWLNTNHSAPLWSTSDPTGNVFRYCNQPSAAICAKSIPTYKKLRRPALYPGIDWVLYGRDGQIEYDLVLAPGADVRQARLRVEGAPATLDAQGRLHAGSILHWQPEAYQIIDGAKVSVKAELRRHEDGDFGFILGNYRRDRELVIDPVIQAVAAIGGAADDEIRGFTSTASSSSYRYGVTRSGDWNRSFTDKRKDVFIQVENGASFTTLFWGGSGDEEIGGADFDPVNPRLTIVGWSSSQDALLMSPDNNMRPYAGGASDGFLLQVEWQNLTYANFLGGPGTDRLNDVRTEGSTYAIAGETDDVSWPNALAERIGAGGKVDAFVGQFDRRTVRMVVTGGSGDDRASRLRRAGSKRWVMVGDTDSPDFPATDGVQAASARDVWVGLLSDELRPSMMRLYGGSGNESAAGVFHVEGAGLYVGGTTTSLDLPGAVGPFRGGESDGFMIQLDAVSGMPLIATYIGGSGADEISTMDGGAGDLRIGGSTASAELNVPGLTTAEKALGGRDGLFVLCDLTTAPVFGLRVGGSEDDRVLSVASSGLGKVRLAGWSESAGWLGKLDEFRTPGGRDGFVVDASFSALRVTPDAPIYIGRNLQTRITIDVAAEPGNDGMLLVRSSDPSKLLVSTRWDLIGTEQVLLSEIDVPRYEYMRTVVLQALSDEGDVDIILEPRAGAPSPAYPSRRVRVKLTPSGLFVDQAGEIVTRPGSDASLEAYYAAVLPDGKPGPKQTLRGGLTSDVSLVFSNPALAATPKDPPWQDGQGGHRLGLRVLGEGVFTATPVSSHVRLGQPVTIRAASNTPVVFNRSAIELAKDHQTTFAWVGSPGDSLRFTTDDPARLRVGRSATELSESVTLAFDAANQLRTVWIEALDREGVVTVRVDGTLNGKGVDENLQITLLPYKATLNASENRIGPGREIYFTLTTTPQISGAQVASGNRQPAPRIASARLISTSPEVLKIEPYLSRRVAVGVTPGTARVEWEPGVPPELQEARVDVEVVPLVFTAIVPELLVPAGGEVPVSVTTNGSRDLLKTVRLRMATPTPFTIGVFDRGTDVTVDFTSFSYDVTLSAGEARAGETGTVQVSAPGLPPFNIPVRVVAPLFLPTYNQVRARTQGMLQFDLWGDRDGSAVPLPPGARIIKPATVRATSSAPGLCAFPDRTEFSGGVFSFNIPFTCSGAGKTLVALQPGNGASSIQAQYAVEVTVSPTQQPERRLDVPIRVLTGAGVQAPLEVRSQNGIPFRGTLTSTDPDRVRLALSPEARGGASVRMQSSSTVYVQGFATEGVVTLRAESEDGLSSDIAVHLFPATMAVRPDSYSGVYEDRAPNLSIEQALSEPDLPLIALPFLLEPASRKLIYVQGLQVRGATDPVFLPGTSSDEAVATIVGPGAILQEGAATTPLKLKIHKTGETLVTVGQPEGFVLSPESSLRVRVFERELAFANGIPLLSRDMQTPVQVTPKLTNSSSTVPEEVTVTTLDPSKIVLSSDGGLTSRDSLVVPMRVPMVLQAGPGATPGDRVRIRLASPGYATTEAEVRIAPAELQRYSDSVLELQPENDFNRLDLVYGPVDSPLATAVSQSFSGAMKPGIDVFLTVTSSDPSVVEVAQPQVRLDRSMQVRLRALRPGSAELRVEAPAGIDNKIAPIPVTVLPFRFQLTRSESPAAFLVSRLTIRNPRKQAVPITFSAPASSVLFGTAASGSAAPSLSILTVTVGPSEERSIFLQATSPQQSSANIRVSAPDFVTLDEYLSIQKPVIRFNQSGPVVAALGNGSMTVSLVTGVNLSELPLGNSLGGPLRIQLQSSNPQVVRVPATPVEIQPGESRKSAVLQLTGRGEAVVSFITASGFDAGTNQTISVTVR